MNRFILSVIAILLLIFLTLASFYYRDILSEEPVLTYTCEPLNLTVLDITATGFTLQWETVDECLGLVKYGNSIDSMNFMALNESRNVSKNHFVKLKNLQPSSTYYLVIFSGDTNYGAEGSPITVTTTPF
jgi:hypothetical protein